MHFWRTTALPLGERRCGRRKANAIGERFGGSLRRECLDFVISAQRTPSKEDCPRMGKPLQPRQASLLLRPWITGTHAGQSSRQWPQAQAASRFPYGEEICAWWLAPRIRPGEGGCIKTTLVFADHRYRRIRIGPAASNMLGTQERTPTGVGVLNCATLEICSTGPLPFH